MKPISKSKIQERLKTLRLVGDNFKLGSDRERRNAMDSVALLKKWGQLDGMNITSRQNLDGTFTIYVAP